MRFLRVVLALIVLGGIAIGFFTVVRSRNPVASLPDPTRPEPWTVKTLDPRGKDAVFLTNGQVGVLVGRTGFAFDLAGGPLPAFAMDAYELEGEERIRALRSPLAVDVTIDGIKLAGDVLHSYAQEQSFRTGRLETDYWIYRDRKRVRVEVLQAVDPSRPCLVTELKFSSGQPVTIQLAPAESARWTTKFLESEAWKQDGSTWGIELQPNVSASLKIISAYGQPPAEQPGMPDWTNAFASDIEVEGSVEDQQAIRSMLFALRSSVPSTPSEVRVSPMMLSNEVYNGHVFWDADAWVFPALALLEPDRARKIPEYRLKHAAQAADNAKTAAQRDPTIPFGEPERLASAMMFPWESSVSGRETVPGPSKYQHHITGTVAFWMQRAADLGLVPQSEADRIGRGAAQFWLARMRKRPDGFYGIEYVMSPDENHTGDNDLYTNLLAQWTIDRYAPGHGRTVYLPKDAVSFLNYDGDALRKYKQSAGMLALYPLQAPEVELQAMKMFERFGDKTSRNGPAMSDSVHALIAARLGLSRTAYGLWRKSWFDFTRGGMLQFSEKRVLRRTYFLTGAGGSIQTVLYGFAGIRIDPKKDELARASLPLKNGMWLNIKPQLPREWQSLKIKGLAVLDRRYDVAIRANKVTIAPAAGE